MGKGSRTMIFDRKARVDDLLRTTEILFYLEDFAMRRIRRVRD